MRCDPIRLAVLPLTLLACLTAGALLAQPAPGDGPPPGMAPPHGPPVPGDHGPGFPGGPGPGGPLAALAKAEADKAAAETIAALAKAPADEVQRFVRTWNVPAALRYYDVDMQAFHEAATPRLIALVQAAAHDQAITAGDAARITAQLRKGPPGQPPAPPPE